MFHPARQFIKSIEVFDGDGPKLPEIFSTAGKEADYQVLARLTLHGNVSQLCAEEDDLIASLLEQSLSLAGVFDWADFSERSKSESLLSQLQATDELGIVHCTIDVDDVATPSTMDLILRTESWHPRELKFARQILALCGESLADQGSLGDVEAAYLKRQAT